MAFVAAGVSPSALPEEFILGVTQSAGPEISFDPRYTAALPLPTGTEPSAPSGTASTPAASG